MPYPLLPYVDLSGPVEIESLTKISVTGSLLFKISNSEQLTQFKELTKSQPSFSQIKLNVDLSVSEIAIDDIILLLNNGVSQLLIAESQYQELIDAGIPSDRVILRLTESSHIGFYEKVKAFSLPSTEPLGNLKNLPESLSVYAEIIDTTHIAVASLVTAGISPIIAATSLTTEDAVEGGKLNIADLLLPRLKTDRADGLYTTLVTDVAGHSLGLVYSSKESIKAAIANKAGVYQSRRHGLWFKGKTSGATQELIRLDLDCDGDCLNFVVTQTGVGFCHLETDSCFGDLTGLSRLEATLKDRLVNAPEGSYTKRLFTDEALLQAKIKEEAEELTEAETKEDIAWECADLLYFALARCVKNGVSLADIERNLDLKGLKITRRKGDAKPKFIKTEDSKPAEKKQKTEEPAAAAAAAAEPERIKMQVIDASTASEAEIKAALDRPVQKTSDIMKLVNPIIDAVKSEGDAALLNLTAKFDGVQLSSPVIKAPFDPSLYAAVSQELRDAIDLSISNVEKFHAAQLQTETLSVETQPGVVCSRFARPITSVGLYVPGGTAVLPSTAIMLGVPANVAGCSNIILASPPRKDGTISPEVAYVAHKVGAKMIVLAGGAQAVAAMAYGTQSVPKVDKILGPGNQFVTAAKMYIQNDTTALCSIDMPAGPSEVLVIADEDADADFVASDLLSQAEHGVDSQVILIGVKLSPKKLAEIEEAVEKQALALPRVDIVRACIKHSTTLLVDSYEKAIDLSNQYAPEHLILQLNDAASFVKDVDHAGSIFVGAYSPESLGDYSSGTNHTLPTYGYARMYSGVNTATFQKFITSQDVTPEGLKNIGRAVMSIAKVEGLDGHRNAVKVRMQKLGLLEENFV
ncbi:hypothetical protein WICPIJ_005982 [Wickerhamomyces pijperi]|uniref:Histidine biosynthesis trifunctional protein n=1 Tax=Wickerhamomyces pijperi TaxID=599730 RepID=A0A9P8TLU1_WICPI|nr:hypothetical protein WICPIJ_005982 [Wickerhamomyces pijperi]